MVDHKASLGKFKKFEIMSSISSDHNERKGCVFMCYVSLCGYVLEWPDGQTQSHSLWWPAILSACRTWCAKWPHPDFLSLMAIFFQRAMISPSSSTPWAKPCPSAQFIHFWLTMLISESLPCASLETHKGQSWAPVSECCSVSAG